MKDLKLREDKDTNLLQDVSSMDTAPPYRRARRGGVALGYAEQRLPSFVTCPAALDELVLSHASCRMPHGVGHPALQNLDGTSTISTAPIEGRPHMLFLTGDQIYADDVSAALLPGLNTLAIQLLGDVSRCLSRASRCPPPRGRAHARQHDGAAGGLPAAGDRKRGVHVRLGFESPDRIRRVPGDVLRGLESGAVAVAGGRRQQ